MFTTTNIQRITYEVIVRQTNENGLQLKEVTYKGEQLHYEDLIEVLQLVTDQLGFVEDIGKALDECDAESVTHLKEQLAAAEETAFLQEGGPTYVGSQIATAPEGVYRINYKSGHSHITVITNSNGDKELIVFDEKNGHYDMCFITDGLADSIGQHISSIQFLRPL